MKTAAFIFLSLSFAVGLFAAEPASKVEMKIMDQFTDHLVDLIQRKDSSGYKAQCFSPTDQFKNIRTGKSVDFPAKYDPSVRGAVEKKFVSLIDRIEKALGDPKTITCTGFKYFIRRPPQDEEFGFFVFDVTLALEANGKSLNVLQPNCVLCMRGVLVGDGPSVQDSDTN